jgi:hypothetical protein
MRDRCLMRHAVADGMRPELDGIRYFCRKRNDASNQRTPTRPLPNTC